MADKSKPEIIAKQRTKPAAKCRFIDYEAGEEGHREEGRSSLDDEDSESHPSKVDLEFVCDSEDTAGILECSSRW